MQICVQLNDICIWECLQCVGLDVRVTKQVEEHIYTPHLQFRHSFGKECQLEQVSLCLSKGPSGNLPYSTCHADSYYTLGLVFTPIVPRAAHEAYFHDSRECSHREFPDVAVLAPPCGSFSADL